MAKLTNNWVGYLDRSYEQIKSSLLNRLIVNNPEITDHNESNLLIVILSMFAGIAEMIGYYIDNMAREGFLSSARKYTSVVTHAKLIDYRIRACAASKVDFIFTLVDENTGEDADAINAILIPAGTEVQHPNGISFFTLIDAYILAGTYAVAISAANQIKIKQYLLGQSTGSSNQTFELPNNYVEGSMIIHIAGELWFEFNSFAQMKSFDKGFIIDIDEDGISYLKFGDGYNGAIPLLNQSINVEYYITDAELGNLPPNTIINLADAINFTQQGVQIKVTNPDYSAGGASFQNIEQIRNLAPRSLRTLERAVTYQDYKDLALLVPGVGQAEVSFCCGKFITIYILPISKGNSALGLNNDVDNYFGCRKMITTAITVLSAGLSKLYVIGTITGKPLFKSNDILADVINALDDKFGYSSATINNKIRLSDIIAALDSLEKVDQVDIVSIRIQPFVRIINGLRPLDITFNVLPSSSKYFTYKIRWDDSAGRFFIYKNGVFQEQLISGGNYNDDVIGFHLNNTFASVDNDTWQFQITPSYPEIFPASIQIKDYSAALIDIGPATDDGSPRTIYSDLTIITTSVSSNCKPPCN